MEYNKHEQVLMGTKGETGFIFKWNNQRGFKQEDNL